MSHAASWLGELEEFPAVGGTDLHAKVIFHRSRWHGNRKGKPVFHDDFRLQLRADVAFGVQSNTALPPSMSRPPLTIYSQIPIRLGVQLDTVLVSR